jgi:hypothetical protein
MKVPRQKLDDNISVAIAPTLWLILGGSGLFVLTAYASQPSWWSTGGARCRTQCGHGAAGCHQRRRGNGQSPQQSRLSLVWMASHTYIAIIVGFLQL